MDMDDLRRKCEDKLKRANLTEKYKALERQNVSNAGSQFSTWFPTQNKSSVINPVSQFKVPSVPSMKCKEPNASCDKDLWQINSLLVAQFSPKAQRNIFALKNFMNVIFSSYYNGNIEDNVIDEYYAHLKEYLVTFIEQGPMAGNQQDQPLRPPDIGHTYAPSVISVNSEMNQADRCQNMTQDRSSGTVLKNPLKEVGQNTTSNASAPFMYPLYLSSYLGNATRDKSSVQQNENNKPTTSQSPILGQNPFTQGIFSSEEEQNPCKKNNKLNRSITKKNKNENKFPAQSVVKDCSVILSDVIQLKNWTISCAGGDSSKVPLYGQIVASDGVQKRKFVGHIRSRSRVSSNIVKTNQGTFRLVGNIKANNNTNHGILKQFQKSFPRNWRKAINQSMMGDD